MEKRKGETEINHLKDTASMKFTVRNDYAFKKLFGSETNKDILAEFLSLVTGMPQEDFNEIQIADPLLLPQVLDKKAGILDLKLHLANGRKIDIEIQNYWMDFYPKRSLFYWAEMYTEDMEKGENYGKLEKCIMINLLNERFPYTEKWHSRYKLLETEEYSELDELLELHFLDLTRVLPKEGQGAQGSAELETICPEGLSLLERWLIFIRTQESEVREAMAKGHATLEKANRMMEEFHLDKQERMRYQAAMKYERDYNSEMAWREQKGMEEGIRIGEARGRVEGEVLGRVEGETFGRHSEKLQTARNMKAKALDIFLIQEITGLTAEEIAEL